MNKDRFSRQERAAFYSVLEYLDPRHIYILPDREADILSYTKKIKNHGFIPGRPGDKELTRALIIMKLITVYQYTAEMIEIGTKFSSGGTGNNFGQMKNIDICIRNKAGDIEVLCDVVEIYHFHGTDNPAIKKELFDPFKQIAQYNKARYLFQLSVDVPLHNEHFPFYCIGINTSTTNTFKKWSTRGKLPHFVDMILPGEKPVVPDLYINRAGDEIIHNKDFKDLDDNFGIEKIKHIWKQLWHYIWGGTLEDNTKFENFNKVLLAKIYDEKKTDPGTPYGFQRKLIGGRLQTDKELADTIDLLYRKAYREYVSKDRSIDLFHMKGIDFKEFSPFLVSQCVELLQGLSLHNNRYKHMDILGEFYETVIRDTFKQTKGLFLTHPNIVLFILSVLDIDEVIITLLKDQDTDNRNRLPLVIDPSCGTGTFLVHYMQFVQKYLDEHNKEFPGGDECMTDVMESTRPGRNSYTWVRDSVYGIDNDAVLATACQINVILHGKGSTNIYHADGLSSLQTYRTMEMTSDSPIHFSPATEKTDYYHKETLNKFDFVISNPPFNVSMNKNKIRDGFTIQGKSEACFLERWYQLLKPGGRIGVVLPESFFSVEDNITGRFFLYRHFNIKAIVALPSHAFQPHTPAQTSLLFAAKKTIAEENEYEELWKAYSKLFILKAEIISSNMKQQESDTEYCRQGPPAGNRMRCLLEKIDHTCTKEFGAGFVVLPYFDDHLIQMKENYSKIKKTINERVKSIHDRWVLHKVAEKQKTTFYNFSVDNIGYKSGKKGSRDKPNELFSVYDEHNRKIYNIKYSCSWNRIDDHDTETVLGIIKGLHIWQ